MRVRTRRNAWPRARRAHGDAAHIGWAYRRDRKKKGTVMEYLRAAHLPPRTLRKYRKARKTSSKVLLRKRTRRRRASGRPRRKFVTRPFLVNAKNWYSRYVKSFARKHPGIGGRSLMKAAARAYRGGRGVRRNQIDPGTVYFNAGRKRRRRPQRGRRLGVTRRRRYARPQRRRHSHRRNPVLPYFAFENRRHRRRGHRRNPVLPYAAFNPRARAYAADPVATLKSAVETGFSVPFWKDTVLPLGIGFVGGQFAGGMVYGLVEKFGGETVMGAGFFPTVARLGSRILGSAVVAGISAMVTKKADFATKVLAGGLVAVLAGILQELLGSATYAKITGMEGFGSMADDLTEELKARIAESVRGEVSAAEGGYSPGTSAFVSTQNLQTAPHLGPGPRVGEMGSFVTTQELATAPRFQEYPEGTPGVAPSEPPVVADLNAFSDSFADMMLI